MAEKIRLIPTLLYKDFGLVKGVGFDSWRRVGSAMQAIKVYNMREVDELAFLDITATINARPPDYALIDDLADDCFMPFAVGGGIRNIEDVRKLLQVGADKVIINTSAVESPDLISEIANRFGSQCVVVSIDAKLKPDGTYQVYIHSGRIPVDLQPEMLAAKAESLGAGEILITSIDKDGTLQGYDIELISRVSRSVTIPVIASGGAGNYLHMVEALRDGNATAVAAASIFHFTQQTPLEIKHHLLHAGFNMRI